MYSGQQLSIELMEPVSVAVSAAYAGSTRHPTRQSLFLLGRVGALTWTSSPDCALSGVSVPRDAGAIQGHPISLRVMYYPGAVSS